MPPSLRKLIGSWYPGYRGTLGTGAFTLIELLITISILAILGSAISIVLNPAELLAEARDSQRINDLESLRNSLSLTLIDNPSLFGSLSNTSIYLSLPSSSCLTNPPSGYTYICNATSLNLQKTDSTGWLPLSLTNLPVFPIDPVNSSSSSLYYAFVPDSTNHTFVLASLLESEKYLKLSALKDGGTDPGRIEEGNPALWTSASGLVGYWPMDEGTGTTAQDLSGNNNTGVVSGGSSWVVGKISNSLSFDGVSGNLPTTYSFISGPKSISAWIKPGALASDYQGIVGDWWYSAVAGGEQINLGTNYDKIYFHLYSADKGLAASLVSPAAIQINNWYHVVATYSGGGSASIFINGNQVASGTFPIDINNHAKSLLIGHWRVGPAATLSRAFNGPIDEVRVYNRALSAGDVMAIYTSQK